MSSFDNDRMKVFTYLANCRAQVKVSTYLVTPTGQVDHNYVVVHDAPPRVVNEIVGMFAMVGLVKDQGLVIPLNKEKP